MSRVPGAACAGPRPAGPPSVRARGSRAPEGGAALGSLSEAVAVPAMVSPSRIRGITSDPEAEVTIPARAADPGEAIHASTSASDPASAQPVKWGPP